MTATGSKRSSVIEDATGDCGDVVVVCSWCRCVKCSDSAGKAVWLKPDQYVARGGDLSSPLSHGICRSCFDLVLRSEIRQQIATVGNA